MKNLNSFFPNGKLLAFLVFFTLIHLNSGATGMSGSYTIDKSGSGSSNFTTFKKALKMLNDSGVSGPVVFSIAKGTYNEQVLINHIKGASSVNTIEFTSKSGDSSSVIITNNYVGTDSLHGYVVRLAHASFVKINKLTLRKGSIGSSSSVYDNVLEIVGGSDSNAISNCRLIGNFSFKSSDYSSIIYSNTGIDNNNLFQNNYIKNGYKGIEWQGDYSRKICETGNIFTANIIDSCYHSGIILEYQDNLSVTLNKINMPYGYYGIFMNSIGIPSGSGQNIIVNNFISIGNNISYPGDNFGIFGISLSHLKIVFNNVNIYGSAYNATRSIYPSTLATYAAMLAGDTGVILENNNLVNLNNTNTDYALYASNIDSANYNNLVNKGSWIVSYNSVLYSTLADWKTNIYSLGKKDTSLNPLFSSPTDLHINNLGLYHSGKNLNYVKSDIDGQARNVLPDIGADEFSLARNDASVDSILSPTPGFCAGVQNISARISNWGSNALSSVTLSWSLNGVMQGGTTATLSPALATGASANVVLGTYTFGSASIYTIKLYISSPNGTSYTTHKNDSLSESFGAGLSGKYTIGDSTSDFLSFRSAVAALNLRGTCGAVVFNVKDGYYNESIQINKIYGSSSTNTVVFQSQSLDSSKVILDTTWCNTTYNPDGIYNTLTLNGASWLTFRSMTIKNSCASTYNYFSSCIDIHGGSSYISFLNNRIIAPIGKQNSSGCSAITSREDLDSFITISNNLIKYGVMGIYFTNYSMTSLPYSFESGLKIDHNIFDSVYSSAIYLQFMQSAIVTDNTFDHFINGGAALNTVVCNGMTVARNKINIEHGGFGIAFTYFNSSITADTGYIYNNFITVAGDITIGSMGIYIGWLSQKINIFNNNIDILSGGTTTPLYIWVSTYTRVYNNILVNKAEGSTIFINPTATIFPCDYNDLYTNGPTIAINGTTSYSSFSDWQTNSGMDSHSVSMNPIFFSNTNLHVRNLNLRAGIPSSLTRDIDGLPRSGSKPTIGAAEIIPRKNDAAILSIDSPVIGFCSGTKNIYATIGNNGSNILTQADIGWRVNDTIMTTYHWKGSISPAGSVSINLGNYNFPQGQIKKIWVYVEKANDTFSITTFNDSDSIITGAGLHGSLSIGGSTADFPDFRSAANVLNSIGVCGSTIFNVNDGKYNESVTLTSIPGSSNVNKITFQSASGDSSKVILDTAYGGSTYNAIGYGTFSLNGASYVTIQKMTIRNSYNVKGGYNANAINLNSGSSNINILNNRIIGPSSITDYGTGINCPQFDTFIVIKNNAIKRGYYGIYIVGQYFIYLNGLEIAYNTIDSTTYMGMALYELYSANIHDNILRENGFYGMLISIAQGNTRIYNNKISMHSGEYGLCLSFINFYNPDTAYVYNNFISVKALYYQAVILEDCNDIKFYNNSIYNTNSGGFGINHVTVATGIELYNNNFVSDGVGFPLFLWNRNNIAYSDYNNYRNISNPQYLAGFGNEIYSTLGDWVRATGLDSHSVSINPKYKSTTDLHASEVRLAAGTPLSIKTDIDGNARNTLRPSIGASEVPRLNNDAGVVSIDSPSSVSCGGISNIVVTLTNFGTDTLDTVTINYSINNSVMPAKKLSALGLAPLNSVQLKIDTISLGRSASVINAWSSNPNGVKDLDSLNDAAPSLTRSVGLSGIYTIDKKGVGASNFTSFKAAASALNTGGVCGAVIFNAADGTYKESFSLNSVQGTSPANTITFQSKSLDSTKVIIEDTLSGDRYNHGYVIRINNSSYIHTRKMTIKNVTTTRAYRYNDAIDMLNGDSFNIIENNIIADVRSSGGAAVENEDKSVDNYNIIRNNHISDGYYAVYTGGVWVGGYGFNYSYHPEKGNIITGNTIDAANDGIYSICTDSISISNNKIMVSGTGIYMFDNYSSSGYDNSWVVNNFVSAGDGIWLGDCNQVNVYNNSVSAYGGNAGIFMGYSGFSQKNTVMNNIFYSQGGCGIYANQRGFDVSDYNDIYSDKWVAYWVSFDENYYCPTLFDWQTASGLDSNSSSLNPSFKSASNGDLHLKASSLVRGKGISLSSVPTDIDAEPRRNIYPDLGADEFYSHEHDMAMSAILSPLNNSCGMDSTTIQVKISNRGKHTESGFSVNVLLSGVASASSSYTCPNNLLAGKDTVITLGFSPKLNTSNGGSYTLTAYTQLATDSNPLNDTLKSVLFIVARPVAGFKYTGTCLGDTVHFVDTSTTKSGTIMKYSWDLGNSKTDSMPNTTAYYSAKGYYPVKLKVLNSFGCADSVVKTITIDSISAKFTYINSFGNTFNFKAADSLLKSYTWNFGDSTSGSGNPVSHLYKKGRFNTSLTVDNKAGCMKIYSDSVNVLITDIMENAIDNFLLDLSPNPFYENTSVHFNLPEGENVNMDLFDLTGKKLAAIISSANMSTGYHSVNINAQEYNLNAGIYILKCSFGDKMIERKIVSLGNK